MAVVKITVALLDPIALQAQALPLLYNSICDAEVFGQVLSYFLCATSFHVRSGRGGCSLFGDQVWHQALPSGPLHALNEVGAFPNKDP